MVISYGDAGVDLAAAHALVEQIRPLAARVRIPEILADIGGFAGLCGLPSGMTDPVLVSGADGVGTKLDIAISAGQHGSIGIDLVAMCINDVITTGARPLFFLDYLATQKLNSDVARAVISGIAEGCAQANCALLGGETAELPSMHASDHYHLAGFAVGVVERHLIIDGHFSSPGDVVIAVSSSGLHANGFSLVREIVRCSSAIDYVSYVPSLGSSLRQALLVPTRIYVRAVAALQLALPHAALRGIAHITGGGLPTNLPRVIPPGLGVRLNMKSFERPPIFRWIADHGPVDESEMLRTFNLGVGLCAIVDPAYASVAIDALQSVGEQAWRVGDLVPVGESTGQEPRVRFE